MEINICDQMVLIDPCDANLISQYNWTLIKGRHTYYAVGWLKGEKKVGTIGMHRLLLNAQVGQIVDHINQNGLDNRRENLRFASRSLNRANSKLNKNNTSGFRGVTWFKPASVWMAYISYNKKRIHLGNYKNSEDGARAYDKAALELFGPTAMLNFPE